MKKYLLVFILGLVSFSVYSNSLRGEFLIDDTSGILNNQSLHNLKTYFSQGFSIRTGALWSLTRAIIWHFWQDNTFYYHLFNVALFTITVLLLFALSNSLFDNTALSFLASLIFAVHPIHSEAVSWISGGSYVLSGMFFILALLFYIKPANPKKNMLIAALFFLLSLLSGNNAVMLPVIFLVYDLFFREKANTADAPYKRLRMIFLSLCLLVSLCILCAFFIMRNKFIHSIFYFRNFSYPIVVIKALAYYLQILYLPLKRGLYHPFAYTDSNINKISPLFFISLGIIVLSVLLFFKCRKNFKPLAFAIAWFFITFLPFSNIIPICNIISERYMYLPSFGFCLGIAFLFVKAWGLINKSKALRIAAMSAITLYFISYAALTIRHNLEFKNIIAYWEGNIRNFPDGYKAYNNLAGTFYVQGEREQALAYCWVNLMINPKQAHVWCNLGKVYREKGDLRLAKFCYEQAINLDKGFLPAHNALGEINRTLKN